MLPTTSLLLFAAIALANPLAKSNLPKQDETQPHSWRRSADPALPKQKETRPITFRGINPDNIDLFVRGANNTLVRRTAGDLPLFAKRDSEPGQVTATGSGDCSGGNKDESVDTAEQYYCTVFCPMLEQIVTGAPVQVTGDIYCTGTTCAESKINSKSIMTATSFGGTLQSSTKNAADKDAEKILSEIAGALTMSGTFAETTTTTTSSTYTFTLSKGDRGYMQYIPYMVESCGSSYFMNQYCSTLGSTLKANILGFDPMSCIQNPLELPGDDDEDAGIWSFCHTDTNYGCL